MSQPLVSIITPSFNQGQFIQDAMLSIEHQTYPNIEHIIVDGGSSDETLEIIRRYESSYNMRWLSEPDEGMYHAINKGMRMARGNVLAYLNCDDLYLPWSVQTAVRALEKSPIIFGDWLPLDRAQGTIHISFSPPYFAPYYRSVGFIAQPALFFRREVFDRVGPFDEHFKLLGDVDFWLRCDAAGLRPRKVWECLAIAQSHASQLSARYRDRLVEENESIRRRHAGRCIRAVFRHLPVSPVVRRLGLVGYAIGLRWLWPNFRSSQIVHLGWPDVLDEMLLRTWRRSSRTLNWEKLMPTQM